MKLEYFNVGEKVYIVYHYRKRKYKNCYHCTQATININGKEFVCKQCLGKGKIDNGARLEWKVEGPYRITNLEAHVSVNNIEIYYNMEHVNNYYDIKTDIEHKYLFTDINEAKLYCVTKNSEGDRKNERILQ